jgi:hypothetical protein
MAGSSAGISAAGDKPACALLTQAQVSEALAIAVNPGNPIASPASCQWIGKGRFATLTITQSRDGRGPVDQFNAGKTTTTGITKETVTGVGDEAYYIYFAKTDRAALGIVVKKGNSVFEVRVYGFPLAQAKLVGKGLAQKAAAVI